jgi:beta-galactosidase
MKNIKAILTTAMLCASLLASAQATDQLFDKGWTFTHDGQSVTVDLPHDWDIYTAPLPKTGATGTGGGWYAGGKGEYRKTFKTPEGEKVKLHFDGVYQKAEVFINGQKAGQHAYGYTPFTVDITPFLRAKGQDNEVIVKVDNSQQPNCRWYSGSGIYRHVRLQTMPALHIAENGIYITTPEVDIDQAMVKVQVTVENESAIERKATVIVAGIERNETFAPGETKTVEVIFYVDRPKIWSLGNPHLYYSSISLKDLTRYSYTTYIERFGIRSVSFDAKKGFLLNGQPIDLNGTCIHSDDGVLGAMAFDAAEVRKVQLMKDAGFNLIRTSHNPPSRALIQACDSLGMLVIDEAFDGWRTAKNPYDYSTLIDSCGKEDIQAMVLRDRNSPSVIAWSLGNEVIERNELSVVATARMLKKAVLEVDDSRPVTEALCAWPGEVWENFDPHAEVLDVVGYNYMIHKHVTDHERSPERVMLQTESYPRDAFRNWKAVTSFPYIVGDIVWTGLDYLGEAGIGRFYYKGSETPGEHYVQGGIPEWHGAYCGDVDITGWRKPISHYRDMLWNNREAIYMAVKEPDGYRGEIGLTAWSVWPMWESWTWPGWEGKPVEVEVYTKSKEVSLYLNNDLIGTKEVGEDTEYKAVFTVPYKAGTLRATTNRATAELKTAGAPARLRLHADKTILTPDGQDLSFINVEVLDRDGNICPEAAVTCNVAVSGSGQLLAAASADLKDLEPYTSPRVTTWKGRALIVVRNNGKKGKADLTVTSTLPAAKLTLQTK